MLSFHLNEETDVASRNAAFVDRSVEWIASYFNLKPGMKIADFGCGPGLYTTRLAQKEAKVTGIDFSAGSIQHAKEVAAGQGLTIEYIQENYLTFCTDGHFDLILMIMCDFCALSPIQRKEILIKFHTLLQTGGAVLLDVYSSAAFEQREEVIAYGTNLLDGFWSQDKYYGFLNTFKYEGDKVVLDKYTIVEATRTRTVYNWLQYFSPENLEKEFVECGFTIEAVLGNVAGAKYDAGASEFAVVARRI
jgi:cyclopropane fatty-acyl-phospholipid synthase-like methyltransferase